LAFRLAAVALSKALARLDDWFETGGRTILPWESYCTLLGGLLVGGRGGGVGLDPNPLSLRRSRKSGAHVSVTPSSRSFFLPSLDQAISHAPGRPPV